MSGARRTATFSRILLRHKMFRGKRKAPLQTWHIYNNHKEGNVHVMQFHLKTCYLARIQFGNNELNSRKGKSKRNIMESMGMR